MLSVFSILLLLLNSSRRNESSAFPPSTEITLLNMKVCVSVCGVCLMKTITGFKDFPISRSDSYQCLKRRDVVAPTSVRRVCRGWRAQDRCAVTYWITTIIAGSKYRYETSDNLWKMLLSPCWCRYASTDADIFSSNRNNLHLASPLTKQHSSFFPYLTGSINPVWKCRCYHTLQLSAWTVSGFYIHSGGTYSPPSSSLCVCLHARAPRLVLCSLCLL